MHQLSNLGEKPIHIEQLKYEKIKETEKISQATKNTPYGW
jgi:hypothetical protein